MSYSKDQSGWEPPAHIKLRRGQLDAYMLFADPKEQKQRYSIVWPTGYGKTYLVCLAHALFRDIGRINRTLVIVSQDIQFDQYVGTEDDPGLIRDLIELQVPYAGLEWCDTSRVLRSHRLNKADIYIASIQKITNDPGLFADLMQNGTWLVVADEGHHYALHNTWGAAIENLRYEILVSMSATPLRRDGRATVAPSGRPDSYVSLREAVDEQAIRRLISHTLDYFVDIDVTTQEGPTQQRIRLGHLERELAGVDASVWEAQKQVRYNNKYLSQILADAVSCLQQKNARHPRQHQMLVFAMTCKHAAHLVEALNALTQSNDFARWIGVGPDGLDQKTNDANYKAFQNNELPCLVQVNKAGEGFNNKRCSVIVFLNLLGDTPQAHQQIGRGLRRNPSIKAFRQDYCDVFCSIDSPISEILENYEDAMPQFDDDQEWLLHEDMEDIEQGVTRLYRLHNLMILDVEYIETLLYYPFGTLEATVEALREETADKLTTTGLQAPSDEQVARVLKGLLMQQQHPTLFSPKARKLSAQQSVKDAVGQLARNVLRCLYGREYEKVMVGKLCHRIHIAWMRQSSLGHDDMDEKELTEKFTWVQQINNALCETREVPAWLRI